MDLINLTTKMNEMDIKNTHQATQISQNNITLSKHSSNLHTQINKLPKKELSKDITNLEVTIMKNKLENMSPDEIIQDILKKNANRENNLNTGSTETYSPNQIIHENKDIFLENLRNVSVNNFLDSIRNKNYKEITQVYEKKIDEYNLSTKLYRDKKDKELLDYQTQLQNLKVKVSDLETVKDQYNNKNKKLEEDKKEKEDTIHKLQVKFSIFDRLKPIFEEFFKEYPDDDPKQIIEDIKEKREASIRILEDMNKMRDKLFQTKKENNEKFERDRKIIEDYSNKIYEVEMNNKDKAERYLDEISSLKSEMSSYLVYKDENMKLQKMLFHIYNKLIERLTLDRNINIDKSLMVTEKDFKPNLFDNAEIGQYIKTMLVNSHDDLTGKMLRETIAYANMIMRTHLKEKVNQKFDPVSIFKDLKELLDKTKERIKEHEKQKDVLKEKIEKFELENKKLQRDLKYKQIQYENLEKKFEEQFNKKIAKSKELKSNKKNILDEQQLKLNIQVFNTTDEKNIIVDEKRKMRATTAKVNWRNQSVSPNVKDIFITEDELIKNANNNKINNKNDKTRELKSASTRPQTGRMLYVRPKTSAVLFNYTSKKKNLANSNNKIIQLNQSTEKTEDFSIINNKFKKLELSKNSDKLQKKGQYPILPSNSDGFRALVDHTNKLFLYKYKMNKNSNQNIFTRFKSNMETNIKRLDKAKEQVDGYDYEIGDKILNDIQGMIKKMEYNS